MRVFVRFLVAIGLGLGLTPTLAAQDLKVGAAAEVLSADDAMVIGGGIGPGKAKGQEGDLRASAVVIQDSSGRKIALVACDVLMINRDVLDRAAKRVEQATGIPFDHILINATHTHHAPTTVTVHGYQREEAFTKQVEDKIVEADDQGQWPAESSQLVLPTRRGVVGWQEQPAVAERRNDLLDRNARRCGATDRSV